MHKFYKKDNLNSTSTFIALVNALDSNINPEEVKMIHLKDRPHEGVVVVQIEGKGPQPFMVDDVIKPLVEDFEAEVEAIHNLGV